MSNMRRGETRLWDSRRVEQPCRAMPRGGAAADRTLLGERAHWAYEWFTYQSISLALFAFVSFYICVCVCRFQFQFENISSYLALAISRDLLTFAIAILINWKWKLIFIIWLIAMPKNVKCGKLEKHVHNLWITQLALHSFASPLPLSLL